MTFYDPDFDIKYVYKLLKLSEKFGITPPVDKVKEDMKQFKYYSFIVISVLLLGGIFSIYGIIVYLYPLLRSTSAVLLLLNVTALSALNITTVLVAALNTDTWSSFLNLFKYLDDKINAGSSKSQPKNFLIAEVLLYHLVMSCIFGYDAYVWYSNYEWTLFRFCLFRYVNYYHCVITMLVVFHFASALRGRYRRINRLLIKSNDLHNIINSFIPKGAPDRARNMKCIKEVTDYYLLLSELVDMFNKLFGWQIFFMTENIILMLLQVLNSLMLSVDYTQHSRDANHDFTTIFLLTSLSVLLIIFHSRVILHCEDVNAESRNTLTICYNLQQTVDPTSEERKELIIFGDVVSLLKTRTNAAGFYYINRSLLSRVFAYLFSYSIVLIQFNKQQRNNQANDTRLAR